MALGGSAGRNSGKLAAALGSRMGARGAASHGELDLSDGGGDLLEAAGHGGTGSTEGLDGGRPMGW
jgi:hypothetical protein